MRLSDPERMALGLAAEGPPEAIELTVRLASRSRLSFTTAHKLFYDLRVRGLVRRAGERAERIELTEAGRAALAACPATPP